MVHRNTSNGAPRDVCPLKAIDEPHDVIGASGSLPIVEFLRGHSGNLHFRPKI